jgi:excinuclease ABC subunit C
MASRHKTIFKKKFGELLSRDDSSLPAAPGVYCFYDDADRLIYVGKAKNLRRRLGQYKNAQRRKKSRKMRTIVAEGARLEFQVCADHLAACLEETRLIQLHRPKLNVAGAYHFMYPMIGVRREGPEFFLCYTTEPQALREFAFHGAFRSRFHTRNAYRALCELLGYVGHRAKKKIWAPKYSSVTMFRQIPADWEPLWNAFFRGESTEALEALVFALLENAGARKKSAAVQESLNEIRRFVKEEIRPLAAARAYVPGTAYPVPQAERDALFLKHRLREECRTLAPAASELSPG